MEQEKLSFSINGGIPNYNGGVQARTESHLSSTSFLPTLYYLTSTFLTIQIFIPEGLYDLPSQDTLVVSNHHSKCLSKGKITMMEIFSKSDADPFFHQPINGDLISSLCKRTTWLFQLVFN
jgi:hypothetical protein